jgi:tRNA (uracil-5-)-methyltransferase TRM9
MDAATITRLNQINRDFYRITADEFDQTRGEAWPGWEHLFPYLNAPLSVLDIGCGNGRFGVFLARNFTHNTDGFPPPLYAVGRGSGGGDYIFYHGIDSNAALLGHARAALENLPGINVTLEERDIVENPPDAGNYDLVVLFGVLHHIPGAAERLTFMRWLAQQVKPGGLLAFACWRFYEYERFRARIVPWPHDITVEAGDYLLDWRRGATALRYCHYVDDAEHAALVAATGMREILAYRADGQTGDANRYSLLQKST